MWIVRNVRARGWMFGVVGGSRPPVFSVNLQRHRGRLEMFSARVGVWPSGRVLGHDDLGAPIILLIPSALSGDSYKDLPDHLEISCARQPGGPACGLSLRGRSPPKRPWAETDEAATEAASNSILSLRWARPNSWHPSPERLQRRSYHPAYREGNIVISTTSLAHSKPGTRGQNRPAPAPRCCPI